MNYETLVQIYGTEGAKDRIRCGYTGEWSEALQRCLRPYGFVGRRPDRPARPDRPDRPERPVMPDVPDMPMPEPSPEPSMERRAPRPENAEMAIKAEINNRAKMRGMMLS